ncbi:MAG: 2-oxoacid:ferredoxin oxidoreductase subunit beta [Gammaproteobacteria bacterium]|nr:2-oxoacid:ferredoxin oxidoreductase subunit beta [Gammaproteobacteria bacterium]MBK80950.1 2-oxoacid:ferredoxin oxidoreductase subunit beta [Gammaproteobacteria bacterium]
MSEALTFKDYASDQEVRWCPGCGDYSILKAVHRALADVGADPAQTVFVSGIGCSSRLPYYVETYGFHTIHGRAPAIATGVKLANPELDVWVITGDGDGLSIGGNHLLHALRRNVDLNILMFNNEIYGLTKGQYSPTSRLGTTSPSSPAGSFDAPVNPALFAIGAHATFIARAVDIDQKGLPGILTQAREHRGAAFVEILQNCIVYNKDVFDDVVAKKTAAETQIHVEHGQPLIYGKDRDKGLRLNPATLALEAVTLGENGVTETDLMVHDETNPVLAQMLVSLAPPLPTAMGVIHRRHAPAYDASFATLKPHERRHRVKELLHRGNVLDRR